MKGKRVNILIYMHMGMKKTHTHTHKSKALRFRRVLQDICIDCKHAHAYAYIHTKTHVYARRRNCVPATYSYIRTSIRVYKHAHAYINMRTYTYIQAPECWGSVSKYSPKVDVWSVGVIFYIMLTGKVPLHHIQEECDEDVYLGTVANKSGAGADYDYFQVVCRFLWCVCVLYTNELRRRVAYSFEVLFNEIFLMGVGDFFLKMGVTFVGL
jgi:serine/threonine protein kinase